MLLCLLLTAAVVYVVVEFTKPAKSVDVEVFELPEILIAEDDTQKKAYTTPLDTYQVIWTRPLRKDLNPPKPKPKSAPKKPPQPKLPALAGIIFEPGNSFALFAGNRGTIVLKQESELIDKFTLTQILPEGVKLLFGEKIYDVKLPKKGHK